MLLNVVWNDILIVIKCIVCNNIVNSIQNNTVYPYIAWFGMRVTKYWNVLH